MSKSKKFDPSKAVVREKARNLIGSPRPTGVRTYRKKSGRSRGALDPTLNAPQPQYVHLTGKGEDRIEGAPRLSTVGGLHLKFPVPIKTRPSHIPAGQCFQYSAEAIQHANLLRQSEGPNAAAKYLNDLKEKFQQMTTSNELAEGLTRRSEPAPVTEVGGSIEMALADAERKMAHYANEVKRCEAEYKRWQQVSENLRSVVTLTNQPLADLKGSRSNGHSDVEKVPKGFWLEELRSVMKTPTPKLEICHAMYQKHSNKTRGAVYAGINYLVKNGQVHEIDGKLVLPEWMEPDKKAS